MSSQTPDNVQMSHGLRREEVEHWLDVARRLPDVRMHKVVSTREAVRRNNYDDNEQILSQTIERISSELGLARRETS